MSAASTSSSSRGRLRSLPAPFPAIRRLSPSSASSPSRSRPSSVSPVSAGVDEEIVEEEPPLPVPSRSPHVLFDLPAPPPIALSASPAPRGGVGGPSSAPPPSSTFSLLLNAAAPLTSSSASTRALSAASSAEEDSDDEGEGGREREQTTLLRSGLSTVSLSQSPLQRQPQPPSSSLSSASAPTSSPSTASASSSSSFVSPLRLASAAFSRFFSPTRTAPPSPSSPSSALTPSSSFSSVSSATSLSASSRLRSASHKLPSHLLTRTLSSSRASALHLSEGKRVPLSTIVALSSYWFGWSFLWLPLLIVLIPVQAEALAGDASKGAALGSILILGSGVSVLTAPLLGSYSDSSTHPYGRRRPFMIVGTVLASVALLGLALAPSLGFFSAAFALLSLANNFIIAPYSALVPDLIPLEQRGMASGYLGLFSMLGNLMGGAVGSLQSTIGLTAVYLCLTVVHAAAMVHTQPDTVTTALPRHRSAYPFP